MNYRRFQAKPNSPKALRTIEEQNAQAFARVAAEDDPQPSGVACDRCQGELYYTRPHERLLSNPPQKVVQCSKCKWTGTIFV